MKLFQKCTDAMPCTRLAVAASDFEDGPLSEGQGSITKFFGAGGLSCPSFLAPAHYVSSGVALAWQCAKEEMAYVYILCDGRDNSLLIKESSHHRCLKYLCRKTHGFFASSCT